jgi:glycogen operon protein
MTEEDWHTVYTRALQMQVAGLGVDEVDEFGNPIVDDDLLLVINGGHESLEFTSPATDLTAEDWTLLVDTNADDAAETLPPSTKNRMEARSLKLYRRKAYGPRITVIPPSVAVPPRER